MTTDEDSAATAARLKNPPWWILASVLFLIVILLAAYGLNLHSWIVFVVELMIALAALSVGIFLGFLFGIPRGQAPANGENGSDTGASRHPSAPGYTPSTNLEQVADWLTKILVGVGLVEFGELRKALASAGTLVSDSLNISSGVGLISQLVMIAFALLGFLGSFLWTRVYYGAIQFATDFRIWQQIKDRVDKSTEKSQEALSLANMVASGKLTQPGSALVPGGTQALAPVTGQFPVLGVPVYESSIQKERMEIEAKIQEFQREPPIFDSNPTKTIFKSAPSSAKGRRLLGRISLRQDQALVLIVRVEATVDGAPLAGDAIFLLHPTLENPVRRVPCVNNAAEVNFYTEGWFHVVAIVDDLQTVLMLDLRDIPDVPKWFKDI